MEYERGSRLNRDEGCCEGTRMIIRIERGNRKKRKWLAGGMKPIITATPFTNSRLDD